MPFPGGLGHASPCVKGFSHRQQPAYASIQAKLRGLFSRHKPRHSAMQASMFDGYTASVACGPPGSSPECPNRHAFSLEGCLDVEDQAIILLWLRSEAPGASSSSSSGEIAACISFQVCARSFRGKVSVGTRSGLQQCHPGQTCCPLFC